MFNLEARDWYFIIAACLAPVLSVTLLKVLYSAKSHPPIPATKPMIAWLPKYLVEVNLAGADLEAEMSRRLGSFGFRERSRDRHIVYSRGSALGEFSIKIAKLVIAAELPLKNPLALSIEYGTVFGAAFDTGDLWKFCRELCDRLEAVEAA